MYYSTSEQSACCQYTLVSLLVSPGTRTDRILAPPRHRSYVDPPGKDTTAPTCSIGDRSPRPHTGLGGTTGSADRHSAQLSTGVYTTHASPLCEDDIGLESWTAAHEYDMHAWTIYLSIRLEKRENICFQIRTVRSL